MSNDRWVDHDDVTYIYIYAHKLYIQWNIAQLLGMMQSGILLIMGEIGRYYVNIVSQQKAIQRLYHLYVILIITIRKCSGLKDTS